MIQHNIKNNDQQELTESTLVFDLRIYDKMAIYSACYGILDIAYISLELNNQETPYILTINITSKQPKYNSKIIANSIKEQALCIMFIRNRKKKGYGSSNTILKRLVHWMDGWDQQIN